MGGAPMGGAYIALFWRAVPELWRILRPAAAPSRRRNIIALAACNTLASRATRARRGVGLPVVGCRSRQYSVTCRAAVLLLVGALLAF